MRYHNIAYSIVLYILIGGGLFCTSVSQSQRLYHTTVPFTQTKNGTSAPGLGFGEPRNIQLAFKVTF